MLEIRRRNLHVQEREQMQHAIYNAVPANQLGAFGKIRSEEIESRIRQVQGKFKSTPMFRNIFRFPHSFGSCIFSVECSCTEPENFGSGWAIQKHPQERLHLNPMRYCDESWIEFHDEW